MPEITIDSISPQRILQKIGAHEMAFAESFKGEGNPSDGNFQQFNTGWRPTMTEAKEIWLEMFLRNAVVAGTRAGFNFCEFWGWPEVECRDSASYRVVSRIRILRVTHAPPQPRLN